MQALAFTSYALATGTACTLARVGKRSWYFVTADYAFSQAMQRDATGVVLAEGGTVLQDRKTSSSAAGRLPGARGGAYPLL